MVTICCRGPVCVATLGNVMLTFQLSNSEISRQPLSLFAVSGLPTTLRVKGTPVMGLVHSLREDTSGNPVSWVIMVVVAKRSAAA